MNTLSSNPDPANSIDPVATLLLEVARRADTLSATTHGRADRAAWLRAEWEVFERAERARSIERLQPLA